MSDPLPRAACIHRRYEEHLPDDAGLGDYLCPGGQDITDAEIRELAYQAWLKDQTRLIEDALSDEALTVAAAGGNDE